MAERDVEIDIYANDKTAAGAASAGRNFKGLEDEVKKTGKRIAGEGKKAGDTFATSIIDGVRASAGKGTPILAGMAVAASPLIGATIAAAVLGGAGAGGIIGGVALAARDTRVQAAGKLLGERLLGGLENDASVLIGPLLDVFGQIVDRADDLDRIMSRVFAGVADDIGPLAESLLNAGVALGEGLADAVEGAGPVIQELGNGVEAIAGAIGEGLSDLSDNGVEAAQAVADIASAIVLTTNVTFGLVDALSRVYGYARAYAEVTTGDIAGGVAIVAAMEMQTKATGPLGEGYAFVGEEAEDAAAAVQSLNDEIFRAAATNISAAEANLRYAETVKTARDNVDGLSKVSAEEEGNLLRQASAANALVESLIRTGASSDQVAAATVRARSEFIGTATAMGATRARAEELANQYLGIPANVNTRVNLDSASASAELERIKARLGDIPSQINVAIRVTGTGASDSAVRAALNKQNFGGVEGFAAAARHAEARFMAGEGSARAAAAAGGVSRTGGPTPVSVENTLNVSLDGRPFYELTAEAVSTGASRSDFWRRVGKR